MSKSDKNAPSLVQQVINIMQRKLRIGESKHAARLAGTMHLFIFSWATYHIYMAHICLFIHFIQTVHPECHSIWTCRKYVSEWLGYREYCGLSAWTIHLDAKAVGKLFDIRPMDPDYYQPPVRHCGDIKRGRPKEEKDGKGNTKSTFSEKKHRNLIIFAESTNLRWHELAYTYPEYLYDRTRIVNEIARIEAIPAVDRTMHDHFYLIALRDTAFFPNESFFIYVPKGKGGKQRFAPIFGKHADEVVAMCRNAEAGRKLFPNIPSNLPTHQYRAQYATNMYLAYARPIADIPYDTDYHNSTTRMRQSEVYHCRADMAGIKLDKRAMLIVSKALGHNRIDVIRYSYLWPLMQRLRDNPDDESILPYIS